MSTRQEDLQLEFPIHSDNYALKIKATNHLVSASSPYQQIDIYQTVDFGRILLLDGHIQLAERDEAAYHETLVHIPLLSVAEPKSALIVGGGDGGVLREIAKHQSIERIDMIEIDQMVIDLSKEHLPSISDGAFADPRLNLVVGDAFAFMAENRNLYDLIVVDATDTYEDESGEISEMLFTKEFYRSCYRSLSPEGFVVTQCDNPVFCQYSSEQVKPLFAEVFDQMQTYWTLVPSFGGYSACIVGSKGNRIAETYPDRSNSIPLRFLNQTYYELALKTPPFL